MKHNLKILAPFADALMSGDKTFEVRKNDRGVCLSNGLALKFDPNTPVNEVDGAFVIGGEAE